LRFYNTLTRRKEDFHPLEKGHVRMYTCGPTVYDYVHIGNLRTFMFEDILRRYLKYKGFKVTHVMNLTDVDDKTIRGSRREGIPLAQYTDRYKKAFFHDIDTLSLERADINPAATDHVPEMVALVKILLEKGFAYKADGSIYFKISMKSDYGKLAHMKLDELKAGASERMAADEYEKEYASDFALWKAWDENDGDVFWETDLGRGRPGWHIECSAMSQKYLGNTFDIHGGGVDNIFPHNECEIAQAEAATGKPFARYWLLTGSLTVGGVKMSKSLNNFISLKDALARYRPEAIRFFILSGLYRSPMDYSEEAMQGAGRGLERLVGGYPALVRRAAALPPQDAPISSAASDLAEDVRRRFRQAMDEDFNTPAAIAVLFDFTREVNIRLSAENAPGRNELEQYAALYRELAGDVLGVLPKGDAGSQARESSLVQLLVTLRNEARARKEWAVSDSIRDRLAEIGVVLEDGKEGTTWKIQ